MPVSNPKISVFLVDDHPLLRRGIADCINAEPDLQVCGEAASTAQALAGILRSKPDVAVVDISMTGPDGIDLLKDLRAQGATAKLLVFSMHDESIYALRALRAGAAGYVMKSETETTLLNAIRGVHAGKIVVSQRLDNELLRQAFGPASSSANTPLSQLSDRELQVLRLIGVGYQGKQIAAELRVSVKTVESHCANIRAKLKLTGSADLARFAAAHVQSIPMSTANVGIATPRARKAGSKGP